MTSESEVPAAGSGAVELDLADAEAGLARSASESKGQRPAASAGRRRRPRPLTLLAVFALVLFALWGIGAPLVGGSVLGATNEMVGLSPYADAGFAGTQTTNTELDDTYTAEFPSEILFKASLANGTGAQWNPYVSGGMPLAAIPDDALFSPLTIPYYLLPTWLAPGYERLLEIIVAAGGCFLFLRRLGISRAVAITGGVVYAGSAFMVVWLDFPQTRVAAFIPVLFWTLERYLAERRLRDAALISIPVASMLLGGFPSVTGYALLTATAYCLVRLVAGNHVRTGGEDGSKLRALARPALGTAAGVGAGFGLAMFQLLPFSVFLGSWYTVGRGQSGSSHLDPVSLLTAVAPWAFGTVNPGRPPQFILSPNLIESMGYIGAAAAVLVLVALALPRRGRALLPRGIWIFFVAATLVWSELIYLGGPPLAALQSLPGLRALFSINYIGRSRSVLGFLLAVLAAAGLEALLRQRARRSAPARAGWLWGIGVAAAAAAVTADLVWRGARDSVAAQAQLHLRHLAGHAVLRYRHELVNAALLIVIALCCVALLEYSARRRGLSGHDRGWRTARFAAAAAFPLLIMGQSVTFLTQYYPKSNPDTFYPVTDTHRYLAAHLGEQRYAAEGIAMVFGTNSAYALRSVNGHGFTSRTFAELVQGVPGNPVPYQSYITFRPILGAATSPILDLLGAKYFVTALSSRVFGTETVAKGDGTRLALRPGQAVSTAVPVRGRVRAVGITPVGKVPHAIRAADADSWIDVVIRGARGAEVAHSKRLTGLLHAGTPFLVPVAADSVSDHARLTATVTLHTKSPLTIAASHGSAALSVVSGTDDGLRLVHVGTSAIYQRLAAEPRIRWAANAEVVRDRAERVSMLASGSVGSATVVLSAPGPAASGRSASVKVDEDSTDAITATVDARGSGYLVVADADQVGWLATVDGRKAALVAADQGVVAVPVPPGRHIVSMRFAAPHGRIAAWISVATAMALLAVVLGEWWLITRRRSARAVPDLE
jgi:hypothetical protein